MRRNRAEIRKVNPDVRYDSVQVQSFIHRVMKDGKKSTATRVVYDAFDIVGEKTGQAPLEVFQTALKNISPLVEVRPKRIGGATYQVPMDVDERRKFALATRWLIAAVRARKGQPFANSLAAELIDAANNQGPAVRKREETHKMAEANRAFSHFSR